MSASAIEESGSPVPEHLTWAELQQLPEEVADGIELWEGRVVWRWGSPQARRPPLEQQQYMRRLANAMEACAGQAMRKGLTGEGNPPCWQVGIETNVFPAPDKNTYLTPDFLVRRCQPRGADTFAADTVLVGEVLSGSDTPKRREWKMQRYAEAGIPWYWEVELDDQTRDISAVRAYELVTIPADGLEVKPLRPVVYILAGEWEPGDDGIDFPKPFAMRIAWEDLAF